MLRLFVRLFSHPPFSSIFQHHSLLDNNLASQLVEKIEIKKKISLEHWHPHKAISTTRAFNHCLPSCSCRALFNPRSTLVQSKVIPPPAQRHLGCTISFLSSIIPLFLNSLFPSTRKQSLISTIFKNEQKTELYFSWYHVPAMSHFSTLLLTVPPEGIACRLHCHVFTSHPTRAPSPSTTLRLTNAADPDNSRGRPLPCSASFPKLSSPAFLATSCFPSFFNESSFPSPSASYFSLSQNLRPNSIQTPSLHFSSQ